MICSEKFRLLMFKPLTEAITKHCYFDDQKKSDDTNSNFEQRLIFVSGEKIKIHSYLIRL